VNAEQWASEYAARIQTQQCAPRAAMPSRAYVGWRSAEILNAPPRGRQAIAGWLAYQIAYAWHPGSNPWDGVGQSAVDRAIRECDGVTLERRTKSFVPPSIRR
jgi:hypothetical protein